MMKTISGLILVFSLAVIGCNENKDYKSNSQNKSEHKNQEIKSVRVSDDTLMAGDIFVTSGPAGKMEQKQGKVVMIADSVEAMPVILKDDKFMALELTGSRMYQVHQEGDHVSYSPADSVNAAGIGRMMLLTDDGEMLEVKLIGNQMVVLTKDNLMIPLVKK